jgi:DNA-binding LytR/AlgR family response regulator
MTAPTAIIAEDELLQRTEIRAALQLHWPQLQIKAEVSDGVQAMQALDRHAPDVAFLDIHMPGHSGLDVAQHASGKSHVVFITAFDRFAVSAFECGAVDYLLKPLSLDRLRVTIARLQERLRDPPADLTSLVGLLKEAVGAESRYLKWFTVPKGSELHVVAAAEIAFLRADNKYTSVATRHENFLLNSSLKDLLEKLDPAMFWQVHRSIVVNVGAIDTIFRSFRGALELKLKGRDDLLPVSSTYAHRFKHF